MPVESNPSVAHHGIEAVRQRAMQWRLSILFGLVSLALAVGGYAYYRQQAGEIRNQKYNELKSIAGLKIDQVVERRTRCMADAGVLANNAFSVPLSAGWSGRPAMPP